MFAMASCSTGGGPGKPAKWGYSGNIGPENWGKLTKLYSMCSKGKNQSPVNLTKTHETYLDPIEFDYQPLGLDIINDGHTIKVTYEEGSTITVDRKQYQLKQVHFHTPSEHQIDDEHLPMEAHLVHTDKMGNLAVLGVFFEIGEKNGLIEDIWSQIPTTMEPQMLSSNPNAKLLIPEDSDYYSLNGSLTTPPCTEGVSWYVFKQPLQVSQEQVDKLLEVLKAPNNRPVQPTNARTILE